eukprot:15341294-Ditylum_brightwellii.AAC.1
MSLFKEEDIKKAIMATISSITVKKGVLEASILSAAKRVFSAKNAEAAKRMADSALYDVPRKQLSITDVVQYSLINFKPDNARRHLATNLSRGQNRKQPGIISDWSLVEDT